MLPNTAGDPTAILLFARTKLSVGRLREPPTDLCLRNYPVSQHKEACQRASRQHLNLTYSPIENRFQLEDLNSPNGTMLDGITIKPGQTSMHDHEADNILVVANVMNLWLRCVPRATERQLELEGAPPADGSSACGIDTKHGFDALIITRPENRPEMAYAMVLRQLTIGGPGSQLLCAGARTRSACQIGLYAGRWIWRVAGSGAAWKPLTNGTELDCGGKKLFAQPGVVPAFLSLPAVSSACAGPAFCGWNAPARGDHGIGLRGQPCSQHRRHPQPSRHEGPLSCASPSPSSPSPR